jgi:hypothetical protein
VETPAPTTPAPAAIAAQAVPDTAAIPAVVVAETKQPLALPSPTTIKLDNTRSKLNEGRTEGIGFAFLKKVGDTAYEAVQPISTCKDYLNGVVYSEQTGRPFYAYGLSTSKNDIFKDFAYLVFATLGPKYGGKHSSYDDEAKLLDTNLPNTQKMINDIEAILKIKGTTVLTNVGSNQVLASIPLEWVASTWMISLWSFIARNAIYYTGGDALKELRACKCPGDTMYGEHILQRVNDFAKNGLPKQNLEATSEIHSNGVYYMFSYTP